MSSKSMKAVQPKSSEVVVLGRRQFLRAAGGGLIAMPFLQSLLPREAKSQTAARPKFFVSMATGHGGVYFDHMFPANAMLTETATYAGRTVRRGNLTPAVAGNVASLSQVLSGSASRFTAALAAKMNVVAGFDIPFYIAHNSGGHLGNFNANDQRVSQPTPTIDQVLAYSNEFYPNLGGVLQRSLHFGGEGYPVSYNWSNPAAQSGEIQRVQPTTDSLSVFEKVFVAATGAPTAQRTPVVDRVFASYQRLTQSNRRLSGADKQRLEDHMARLSEIQRRATVMVDCSGVQRPARSASEVWTYPGPQGVTKSVQTFQLFNDVVVAAFLCGTSRIATIAGNHQDYALFSDFVGDWHGVAHAASAEGNGPVDSVEAETLLRQSNQRFFENAFLDLVAKLDVDDGSGHSLLDDSLVVWTQESGHLTHHSYSIPIVTAGSAGGTLRTGSYIDYRNREVDLPRAVGQRYNPGLIWNQWLGTALQAMGLSRSSYEKAAYQPSRPSGAGNGGYGPIQFGERPQDYQPALGVLGEIPPYLRPA